MPTNVLIRLFEPTEPEYEAVGRIGSANYPEEHHYGAHAVRDWDRQLAGSYIHQRYVVVALQNRQIVGYASYCHNPTMFHPQKFEVELQVDPAWQRRGIGTQLWERLLIDLRSHQAIMIWTEAREDMKHTLSFLEKRGFQESLRAWESRLYLDRFDFAPFASYIERIRSLGIEIATLAEERERIPDCLSKLYELHTTLGQDVPRPEPYTPHSFELFLKRLIETPRSLPEGYFVAKAGDRYIGESLLLRILEDPTILSQGLTGVLREHRRNGIAMALKLKAIEYATQHGYKVITTRNASNNAGMLGVNQKLGFVHQPAWIMLAKTL
ncbi:GNAT family N-acetyltransferase [Candidatus Acetothermia bacterium]|nr:GNAT family N-acetyltransferase [Candidatus Acetothermia bacterium]